ncbi:hypothetical protein AB0H18_10655 [Streptomyces sp. NPDC020766]|uniref:hypothetical protein n=1 Tax=Streptomyces sp. NPDC020766 TaxID=3155011 RepID=UPI0033D25F9C
MKSAPLTIDMGELGTALAQKSEGDPSALLDLVNKVRTAAGVCKAHQWEAPDPQMTSEAGCLAVLYWFETLLSHRQLVIVGGPAKSCPSTEAACSGCGHVHVPCSD